MSRNLTTDNRSKVEFTWVLLSHLKQELLQKIFIFLNKSTKEGILKRTGDKLQEPFNEEIRPGFETMQA